MQKKYSKEFKREAVRRSNESGKPVTQVARELGMSVKRLYKWRNKFEIEKENSVSGEKGNISKEELKKLRRENRILKEERDILKKSLIFFAKDQGKDSDLSGNITENSP